MLFIDRTGNKIAVAAPPLTDERLNEELQKELRILSLYGEPEPCKKGKPPKRGYFKIVRYGNQMGPGSPVSSTFFNATH